MANINDYMDEDGYLEEDAAQAYATEVAQEVAAAMQAQTVETLETTANVTQYLLEEAKLAIVPFYAFGAKKDSPWYRLSVGTSVAEEIDELFNKLNAALSKLS